MARCTFCGTVIERGTGLMYVKKDGTVYHFCSHKCEKNMLKLGRKPRNTGWTMEYQKAKQEGKAPAKEKKEEAPKVKHKKEKPKKEKAKQDDDA